MRHISSTFAALVFAGVLASPEALAQLPPPPPPMPPPGGGMPAHDTSTKPGTAILRGRVFAADTGQPLRKVIIRLSSPELREGRVVTTDKDGRYELKELPAGRYTVNASKGSFVALSYGQLRPFEQGKPLEVLDGQTIDKVDFRLPRGAIVTGRVVDEYGDPVADAQVSPMRSMNQGGRRRLAPSGRMSMTNDIGEYRIFGLAPGQYYVSATLRGGMMMNAQSEDRSGYAPTYYPGTGNVAEAQKITVAIGQTLNDINMPLIPTRIASVSGSAFDSQGRPLAGGMVMIVQRQGVGGFSMNGGGTIRPDGTFTVNGLPPGEYTLQATVPGSGPFESGEFATAEISVAGDDIAGLRLVGLKPSLVTGRIVFSDAQAASSIQPTMLRVSAMPKSPEDFSPFGGGQGRVRDDFTFEIKARPGNAVIRVNMMMSGGWILKTVQLNGADVTDTGIDVKANEDISGIEIEMTNRLSDVSGVVTNARSEPIKDYSVVVFAQDRERWGPSSRFMRTGRPDQDGRFKITGLPPGAYYAIALDYIESGDATDPEVLDRIRDRATKFSLVDGETKTLDLKLIPAS
jgi:protocatechuate 3,4-dioxygenase beta subunit